MNSQHLACYGHMFPDLEDGIEEPKGHVFSIKLCPVMGMLRPHVEAQVNIEKWDECRKCEEFTHCLDLSTAQLVLQATAPHV